MNRRERIKRWVKALRSGEFNQGRGSLHQVVRSKDTGKPKDEYCCLGVACQVYSEETDHGHWMGSDKIGVKRGYYIGLKQLSTVFPPRAVREYFSLTEEDTRFLADMNDKDRKSFDEIADWLESSIAVDEQE